MHQHKSPLPQSQSPLVNAEEIVPRVLVGSHGQLQLQTLETLQQDSSNITLQSLADILTRLCFSVLIIKKNTIIIIIEQKICMSVSLNTYHMHKYITHIRTKLMYSLGGFTSLSN